MKKIKKQMFLVIVILLMVFFIWPEYSKFEKRENKLSKEKAELSLAELADEKGLKLQIILRRGKSLSARSFNNEKEVRLYLRGIK